MFMLVFQVPNADILFLDPWLNPWCLVSLLVLAAGTVGSSSLSGFYVEETGHCGYHNDNPTAFGSF